MLLFAGLVQAGAAMSLGQGGFGDFWVAKPSMQRMPDGTLWGPSHWAMSKSELSRFIDDCHNGVPTRFCTCVEPWDVATWTMTTFVEKCVMPTTDGSDLGVALKTKSLLEATPQKVSLMTSHSWIENADMFFKAVLSIMEDVHEVFICSLAVDQFKKGCQVGSEPLESPFVAAIDSAKEHANGRMFVVTNDALASASKGLYSRGWCILELYVAWQRNLPIEFVASQRSDEYLFGGPLDGQNHSTRNLALAPSLRADLEAVKRIIEETPPVSKTLMSDAAKYARANWDDGNDVASALETADSWSQLDFIAKGAADGLLEKPRYNKTSFIGTLCLQDSLLVPCHRSFTAITQPLSWPLYPVSLYILFSLSKP
eukprot:TRINITY_DN16086_c0_g2_i1.p1 TRINITY_DN16086_c0_g2~~TRINITY_DN16086_c0_g2_i1.p1  ORF type:complete len:370 (+),score=52.30 TRINITY_DN16086_c0_g2_i1:68-1177(+)